MTGEDLEIFPTDVFLVAFSFPVIQRIREVERDDNFSQVGCILANARGGNDVLKFLTEEFRLALEGGVGSDPVTNVVSLVDHFCSRLLSEL